MGNTAKGGLGWILGLLEPQEQQLLFGGLFGGAENSFGLFLSLLKSLAG